MSPLSTSREAYTQLFPSGDAKKFAAHVFETYDKDGDGKVGKKYK